MESTVLTNDIYSVDYVARHVTPFQPIRVKNEKHYISCVEVVWRVDDVIGDVMTIESSSTAPACLDLCGLLAVKRVNKAGCPMSCC